MQHLGQCRARALALACCQDHDVHCARVKVAMRSRARDRNTGMNLRRVLALAAIVLAAGCSSVRVSYNNADTLLVYTLDNYFDLNKPQQQLVRERVRGLMEWHRATQLREYADVIESAGKRLEHRVT